jgi:hypothetical protein
MAGDCCRLDQAASETVTEATIKTGNFAHLAPAAEIKRLRKQHWKSRFYALLRHPSKPKLIGNNVGVWRSDYQRVNGYDENFEGWGGEDDDLRLRLHQARIRIRSILGWTYTYHLWHPSDPTQPKIWREGQNVAYLLRRDRPTRCLNGLHKEVTTNQAAARRASTSR